MFEVVYKIKVNNAGNSVRRNEDLDDFEGVAMFYLNHAPKVEDMHEAFGYKSDFNGVAAYLFRHKGKWRIMSIYNLGLQGLTVEAAVNNLSKFFVYNNLYSFY